MRSSLTMQPAFTVFVPLDAEELMPRIRQAIRTPSLQSHAASAGRCVDFHVDPEEQRFWSPHLNVHVSDVDSGSELYCRFSPRPEVWTMFMAIYFMAAFIIFTASVYAVVQAMLGETPWSLVVIPIAIVVIVGLHMASLVGQRLSSDQMDDLKERFDETLRIADVAEQRDVD